jgi:hypothetical protein
VQSPGPALEPWEARVLRREIMLGR